MNRPEKARSLLAYLLILAAAIGAPPLVLAVVTTTSWVDAERERLRHVAVETVDRATSHLDRYLASKIAMLQAIATSPAIDAADFKRLDSQARELLDLQGANIVMRDLEGQQVVSTRVPWGSPLPKVPIYAADSAAASTNAPVVSDLYPDVAPRGHLVRVIVPVIRDGRVRYTLTASLSPTALAGLLREAGIAAPFIGAITDRAGLILARTKFDANLVGQRLPGFDEVPGPSGAWSGTNVDGLPFYGVYRRSTLSGWLFTVGIEQTVVDAPIRRSLWWLAGLASALALLAAGVSAWIAGRIIRSHRQIAAAARAVGDGAIVEPPKTRLRETDLVGGALAEASMRLRDGADALVAVNRSLEHRIDERTRELSDQASLLRATLDNMDQGLMMVDADGNIPICNQRAIELLDLPEALMSGRPSFESVLRHQLSTGEFARSGEVLRRWVESGGMERQAHTYERERPNGTVIEIRTVPLASGGAVRTYTDITGRKQAERLSAHMARHDSLTGLPNRTLFRERLAQAFEAGTPGRSGFAVLCLDLDRFKVVNDTMGHAAGDALLRAVARRIRDEAGPDDIVARLGGDEFSIIQLDGAHREVSEDLAERLIAAIRRPFELEGRQVEIGVSIGVAIGPLDGHDAEAIFKSADLALYRAKAEGRSALRFYEAAMDVARQEREMLELDLRQALAHDQLVLHYQPIMSARTGQVAAFEALLRWNHPARGLVAPGEFISLAEESRLIIPIGAWVLREACREAASWPAGTRVLVNISSIQLEDGGLFGSVVAALSAAALPARRLQLEITETVLMHEREVVFTGLRALGDLGVGIALDDFGTGYSSLSYLRQFPLDAIKIDRSFVQGHEHPTTAAILAAIVGLGRSLGITIMAEGIETAAQLDHVRACGCDEVQGFLLGYPMPAGEVRNLLSRAGAQPRDDVAVA